MKVAVKKYKRCRKCRFAAVILPAVFVWLTGFVLHPYYLSVTELEYKPATRQIEIACKIFTDDLEDALLHETGKKVDLLNKARQAENEQRIATYLAAHFKIRTDGVERRWRFVGSEINADAIWCYLLADEVPPFQQATIVNDVLFAVRKDQVNILHFVNQGKRQSYRLANPDDTQQFRW